MYELEDSILGLFTNSNKAEVLRSIKSYLKLHNEDEALAYLQTNEIFKSPKNFRPLDYLQYQIRRKLKDNGEYILNRLYNTSKTYFALAGKHNIIHSKVLDLGCGRFDPFMQSAVMFVNGADYALATDIEPCIDMDRSCFNMLDLLSEFIIKPYKWNFSGIDSDEYIRRCQRFDMAAFESGDYEKGISNTPIHYYVGDVRSYNKLVPVTLLVSFAVLEHVMEIREFTEFVYDLLQPGGIIVNQVDFSDHRQNSRGFNFWTFMLMDGVPQPGINGLRLSQLIELFTENGFKELECIPQKTHVPEEVIRNLKYEYSGLSLEDLSTISAWFSMSK